MYQISHLHSLEFSTPPLQQVPTERFQQQPTNIPQESTTDRQLLRDRCPRPKKGPHLVI
eukprot:TRINITY_DN9730_c0_g1_i1.p1 TRINITY_DN9730_c0_g1~~TRINITY_DN9730_c0_g1_i1.p1  ORF type:complete len:59 (-),score=6.46 TRINITY_DN9730_c0_g1_i1:322-498(-)